MPTAKTKKVTKKAPKTPALEKKKTLKTSPTKAKPEVKKSSPAKKAPKATPVKKVVKAKVAKASTPKKTTNSPKKKIVAVKNPAKKVTKTVTKTKKPAAKPLTKKTAPKKASTPTMVDKARQAGKKMMETVEGPAWEKTKEFTKQGAEKASKMATEKLIPEGKSWAQGLFSKVKSLVKRSE